MALCDGNPPLTGDFSLRRASIAESVHDNVTKWKHFPRYGPFVWGIRRSPVNLSPPTKASDTELSCFLWSAPEQTVE